MSGSRFDVENQLSDGQAFTAVAAVSEDSYKKQSAAQDLSIGRRMALTVLPTVACSVGDSVTIEAIQADDAALTVNVEALDSVVVPAADFIPGKEIEVPFPQGTMDRQYLGARVTVTGAGAKTASADIYFVPADEIPKYKSFPKINDAEV